MTMSKLQSWVSSHIAVDDVTDRLLSNRQPMYGRSDPVLPLTDPTKV